MKQGKLLLTDWIDLPKPPEDMSDMGWFVGVGSDDTFIDLGWLKNNAIADFDHEPTAYELELYAALKKKGVKRFKGWLYIEP